eukprot:TRINITY_DN24804_c0_g1_i1.p1 TRINITY_DN24804_c0_g1~~TRINITY_DN24804_c0_g1_i1.p1  ORF type:complete len:257 (+),score=44.03 TRINITY_DN24804_c0_g1_i1:195-965(+)
MGTELQYAVNLLANLPKKKVDAVTTVAEAADSWACSQKRFLNETIQTGFNQFQESMDRFLEQLSGESVRKTMLKQDEIFKEQVRELHRLYRVQKMLMTELRSEKKLHLLANSSSREIPVVSNCMGMDNITGFWTTGSVSQTSHPHNRHGNIQMNSTTNLHHLYNMRANPSSMEQSSSCSENTSRVKRGFDLERPAEEDICTDFSAVEDPTTFFRRSLKDKIGFSVLGDTHFCVEKENEIELTLSIGHCTDKKKQNH